MTIERMGIATAKMNANIWVARSFHFGGVKKTKISTIVARGSKAEIDEVVNQWKADALLWHEKSNGESYFMEDGRAIFERFGIQTWRLGSDNAESNEHRKANQ